MKCATTEFNSGFFFIFLSFFFFFFYLPLQTERRLIFSRFERNMLFVEAQKGRLKETRKFVELCVQRIWNSEYVFWFAFPLKRKHTFMQRNNPYRARRGFYKTTARLGCSVFKKKKKKSTITILPLTVSMPVRSHLSGDQLTADINLFNSAATSTGNRARIFVRVHWRLPAAYLKKMRVDTRSIRIMKTNTPEQYLIIN